MNYELEKLAATNDLVNEGYDFEDAVELVKQASYGGYSDMEKFAAVDELMTDGYVFEDAVELVKQAAEEEKKKMSTGKKVALGLAGIGAAGLAGRSMSIAAAKRAAKRAGGKGFMPRGTGPSPYTMKQVNPKKYLGQSKNK